MEIIRGATALSAFRVQKLMQACEAAALPIQAIYSEFIHLADIDLQLTAAEQEQLHTLLTYGPAVETSEPKGKLYFVTPRPGTLSPWSSKATDIAHNCGLNKVKRLERGIAYYIDAESLNEEQEQLLLPLLYDRMVEVVFNTLNDSEILFSHTSPRPPSSTNSGKALDNPPAPTS